MSALFPFECLYLLKEADHYILYILYLCILQTVRFKNELERNITIKLGYANAKVRKEHLILRSCMLYTLVKDIR